tara:strand:+ start:437 stop:2560 length:2124 start_codon:yes stop_codon:yes gene_type:complete
MKLVRLASNNDGIFTSNFGNDMVLEANSKMALLNLTFKSDIGQIVVGDDKITTWTDQADIGTNISRTLAGQVFPQNQAGLDEFIKVLEFNLNATLEIGIGKATEYNSSGSQYKIIKQNNGNNSILFRYCPFINPMAFTANGGPDGDGRYEEIMSYDSGDMLVDTRSSAVGPPVRIETLTIIKSNITAQVENDNSMISATEIANGCGFMSARVKNLVDNASVLQDNGFAIGLTKVSLPSKNIIGGEAIPVDDIFVELRINRPLETYSYRVPTESTEQQSTVLPHRVATTPPVTGYLNLPLGNDWNQSAGGGTIAVEQFDSLDIFDSIATFRRKQVGGGINWWEATSATDWNIYSTKPKPAATAPVPSATATADLTTGVLTVNGGPTIFTPTGYAAAPDIVTVPVNVNLHDVMGFEICRQEVKIVVYQNQEAPNNRRVITTIKIDPGTKLYPYLYINGEDDEVEIDMFNWTANSLEFAGDADGEPGDGDGNDQEGKGWGPTEENRLYLSRDATGMRNGYEILNLDAIAGKISTALPNPYWGNDAAGRFRQDLQMSLNMPNLLWRYLGFSKAVQDDGSTTLRDTIIERLWTAFFDADGLPLLYDSDNFIVESTSLRLDSYDASKVEYNSTQRFNNNTELAGRRKNILMTIPTNDNTDGLLEFQTNTPIFIDIGNAAKINVKNLNLRVLRKDFSPIKQADETAIMTLLIDS